MTGKGAMSCEWPIQYRILRLTVFSTELDAEKRLALQEEKQALEAKLLEVYVRSRVCRLPDNILTASSPFLNRDHMKERLAELKALVEERGR